MTAALQLYSPDDPRIPPTTTTTGAIGPEHGPTVGEIIGVYLTHSRRQGGARRANEDRKSILDRFSDSTISTFDLRLHGDLRIVEAKPFHLRLWVDAQDSWQSDWTIKRAIATVQACFNWAAKMGMIERNPFWGISHRAGKRGRPISDEEFSCMLREATDGRLRRFILFLRYTGCRPGEAASAKWTDLDLERGVVRLDEHKTARKTGEARTIYLSSLALRLLAWIKRNDGAGETIFLNACGRPWSRAALSERLAGIRERAGLAKDAKWYGNRHRYACDGILRGVELKTLSVLMGHHTTRTTEYYVSIAGQTKHMRDAAEKIFTHGKPPR